MHVSVGLSRFPALAIAPLGKTSFTGSYRSGAAQGRARQLPRTLHGLRAESRASLASQLYALWHSSGISSFNQSSPEPAASRREHSSGVRTSCWHKGKPPFSGSFSLPTIKKCPSFWSPRLPCAVAAHAPLGVRGGTIRAAFSYTSVMTRNKPCQPRT